MANKNTGYQGFVPYRFRAVESSKPGERGEQGRVFRDNKFMKDVGIDLMGYRSGNLETTTDRMGSLVNKSHYASCERPTPIIQLKDRRKVEEKKFVSSSLSLSTFPDHRQRLARLESIDEEKLKSVFTRFDKDNSGFLSKREMRKVFHALTNGKAEPDVVDTFVVIMDKNRDSKISFEEFHSGYSRVVDIVRGQLDTRALRHAGPSWAQERKESILKGYVPQSSAHNDFGAEGESPASRPVMTGTTKDLFAGTSKVANHIPGYRGYISNAHPTSADESRPSKDHMFAVDNFKGNAPVGYTGHKRSNVRGNRGDMHTDKSRADALVVRHWQHKERNPRSQFL